ncbi:hypothetical protein CSA17_04265, partial [bacterium DOLJORAL78_65_58]
MKRKVVLASRNADKVRELQQLFAELDLEVLSSADFPGLPEVIEDGTTTVENARRKAILTAAYTGHIAVADDTSLEIRELNGFPDIFAARFSGPQATYRSNVQLVLELMGDVPAASRQARFSTACVWVDPCPERQDHRAARPAISRWLRNPWARSIGIRDTAREWDFWNGLMDRRRVWDVYRRQMELDQVTWGHDRARLREVAEGLFLGCPDALRPGETLDKSAHQEGVRLPDTRLWAVDGPETSARPLTEVAPSGLPADAPGRETNGPFWFEMATEGKILGDITTEPVGALGFGYDPIFRPEGERRTLAEMPAAEKNAISHRGQAMRRLLTAVRETY